MTSSSLVDGLLERESWLAPHRDVLQRRVAHAAAAEDEITRNEGSLLEFARNRCVCARC
jgi:hypothetical protein